MSQHKNITILKIGGSVITDKSSDSGKVQIEEIERICQEISGYSKDLIIVHGAGSYGHPLAKKYDLDNIPDPKGAVVTHSSVKSLNTIMVSSLQKAGIDAVSVHPLNNTVSNDGRISDMFLGNIHIMLENGLVPVMHGDVVMDTKKNFSVISGDQIVSYLANRMKASRIGIGSIEDGVMDNKGKTLAKITSSNYREIEKFIGSSKNTDVTGGMLGKVNELLQLCEITGTTSYIFNAKKPNNISYFLSGHNIGTAIKK